MRSLYIHIYTHAFIHIDIQTIMKLNTYFEIMTAIKTTRHIIDNKHK